LIFEGDGYEIALLSFFSLSQHNNMASTSALPEYTVIVSNLAASTKKEQLEHFFSFCGKRTSIPLSPHLSRDYELMPSVIV